MTAWRDNSDLQSSQVANSEIEKMTKEQGTIYRAKGRVYKATLLIRNEANQQVPRVA